MELAPSPRPSPAAAGRRAPGGREKSTDPFERFTQGAGIGRRTAPCRSWARRSRRKSCGCAGPVARSLPARCPKASKKLKPTTTVKSGNFVDHLLHQFLRIGKIRFSVFTQRKFVELFLLFAQVQTKKAMRPKSRTRPGFQRVSTRCKRASAKKRIL